MSSKSWDAAGFAIYLAQSLSIRVMATRQFQNRIDESVYTLLKHQIERFGLKKRFAIYNNKIECPDTGSDFLFYGRSRNIDEIKGTEAVDIHWAEECHLMTSEEWKFIDPTLRNDFSQHWLIFNPELATDFVYRRFVLNPPPDTVVRKINYDENPFLSDTALKLIAGAKAEDEDEFNHIYLGMPRDNDDSSIIKRAHILASIDAHKKLGIEPSGFKRIGFDVADGGKDKCAQMFAHGFAVLWGEQWKASEDELLKSCARVWTTAREREAVVSYDSIGVGAGCGAKFNELNDDIIDGKVRHTKFNAGGAVHRPEGYYSVAARIKNKDQFYNIKAQAWWLVADRFRNTFNAVRNGHTFEEGELISLDSSMPELAKLIDELSTPKQDFSKGKVKVESKEDLADRDVPSPNLADALIMCFVPGQMDMVISRGVVDQFSGVLPGVIHPGTAVQRAIGIDVVASFKGMGRTR